MFLRPHRAGQAATVYAVGDVQQENHTVHGALRATPGRAPLALQSWVSPEGIGLRLLCAREKQQHA